MKRKMIAVLCCIFALLLGMVPARVKTYAEEEEKDISKGTVTVTALNGDISTGEDMGFDITLTLDGKELYGYVDYVVDYSSLPEGVQINMKQVYHPQKTEMRETWIVDKEAWDEYEKVWYALCPKCNERFYGDDAEEKIHEHIHDVCQISNFYWKTEQKLVAHHEEEGHYGMAEVIVSPEMTETRPTFVVTDGVPGVYTIKLLDIADIASEIEFSIEVKSNSSTGEGNITPVNDKPGTSVDNPGNGNNDPDPVNESLELTKDFVTRLYRMCLAREPEEAGLAGWTEKLMSGSKTAAEVVYGFFNSKEMIDLNVSNEEFVIRCYAVMLNRAAKESEIAGWVKKLEVGMSRSYILYGFVNSAEFAKVCQSYGVTRGSMSISQPRDKNYGVTAFVSRLYTKTLGRPYDVAGLNGWCGKILTRSWSITSVATHGFFHSQEFYNKNLDNTGFVKVLYRTFLDREAEEAGLKGWVTKLNKGASRDSVISGFANSQEFYNILKKYGVESLR